MTDQDTNNSNKTDSGDNSSSSKHIGDLLEAASSPTKSPTKKRVFLNWRKKAKSKTDANNSSPGIEHTISNTLDAKLISSDKKPKLNRKTKFLVASLVVIIAVIGGWFFFNQSRSEHSKPKDKVVFKIDGKTYKQSDINQYTSFLVLTGKSEPEANKEVFELLKYKIVAEKLNFSPDKDIVEQVKKEIGKVNVGIKDNTEYKQWAELAVLRMAIDRVFQAQTNGDAYKGYSFIFWFANHLGYSMDYTPPGGYGNEDLINKDKEYAKGKADYYNNKILKKEMTPDQVLDGVKKDPKLGLHFIPEANFSKRFGYDTSQSWEQEIYYQSVIEFVKKNHDLKQSRVEIGRSTLRKSANEEPVETDTFYFFVINDGANISKVQFDNTIKSLKAEYLG